jgi:hypothetical protein
MTLHRRLARLDGGDPSRRRVEEMSDAELDRMILGALSPAERETYRTGAPEQVDALLQSIVKKERK